MKFSDFSFHPDLLRGIEATGFQHCMPVQLETFKHLQDGLDVYAQSQTGTGKTAAFLIGGLQHLLSEREENDAFLIVTPTRELAVQIEQDALSLIRFLDFDVACFVGGVGYKEQRQALKNGVKIIVGTPGRLLELSSNGDLNLSNCKVVVIDEADRMFDMGFIDDLRKIFSRLPAKEERLMMLFSATLNNRVGNLSWEYMRKTGEVIIEPEKITASGVNQRLYHLSRDEKIPLLLGLLKKEKPESCLVFTNSKDEAYKISKRLEINGVKNRLLMGSVPQKDRLRIFNQLRNGELSLVIATDVAARGLHIEDLSMVINYDLPDDSENYVHRIGRTARAGKTGEVISFACETYVRNLALIEKFVGYKIPVAWIEDSMIEKDRSNGMHFAQPHKNFRDQRTTRVNKKRTHAPQRAKQTVAKEQKPHKEKAASPTQAKPKQITPAKKKHFTKKDKQTLQNKRKKVQKSKTQNFTPPHNLEERLAYYQKKYGESFKPQGETSSSVKTQQKKKILASEFLQKSNQKPTFIKKFFSLLQRR